MKDKKRTILALYVAASLFAGSSKATTQEQQNGEQETEAAPSVEFYYRDFGARLNAEAKCLQNPDIAKTEMCINARKAANRIRMEIGMKPEYPEVEDGSR